jgi:HEAT repeat protein
MENPETNNLNGVIRDLLDHATAEDNRCRAFSLLIESQLEPEEKTNLVNLMLRDQNEGVRFLATVYAGAVGSSVTAQILRETVDKKGSVSAQTERMALASLARLGGPSLMPELLRRINGTDEEISLHALTTLSNLQGSEACGLLENMASHHIDPKVRFYSSLYLAYSNNPNGIANLVAHLNNSDSPHHHAAVLGLSTLGHERGLQKLQMLIDQISLLSTRQRFLLFAFFKFKLKMNGNEDEILGQARCWIKEQSQNGS